MSESLPLLMGVDTGGTYTDAVLIDPQQHVVASAKARTSHQALHIGIGRAMSDCLRQAGAHGQQVVIVSVSTTLATNAMVEGSGGRCGLVTIGFDDTARSRIDGVRSDDVLVALDGGHTAGGEEVVPLDLSRLAERLDEFAGVGGIAVAGLFAVRNSSHENQVREFLRAETGLPVTCTHELSAALHGPKRAATALANARLVPNVVGLIDALASECAEASIGAPIVVVRSDGTVMSAEVAAERPVETILSGPAASIIGARHLWGLASAPGTSDGPSGQLLDAAVVDIGGTTTDIAMVSGGFPALADGGATVGGVRTMVRAAVVRTVGLGGDSRVHVDQESAELLLGPRRVEPLAALSLSHPGIRSTLEGQLADWLSRDVDGVFLIDPDGFVQPAAAALTGRRSLRSIDQQISRGELTMAAFTPTDAAHVLGEQSGLDADVALLGAELFARRLDRFGRRVAATGLDLSRDVVDLVRRSSAREVAVASGVPIGVVDYALGQSDPRVTVAAQFNMPIIGIGAGSGLYHRAMAELFATEVVVPENAHVANAVGAAVGSVRVEVSTTITQPNEGLFRVHGPGEPSSHATLDEAAADATLRVERAARIQAERAGADAAMAVDVMRRDNVVELSGGKMFVECQVTAVAIGVPQMGETADLSLREGSG